MSERGPMASTFIYRPDMAPDDIPGERVSSEDLGVWRISEYVKVNAELWPLFRPRDRLILALIFAPRVFREDEAGGWVALKAGLCERFDLQDRSVRKRAIDGLEREGVVEVRRARGKASVLRLKGNSPAGNRRMISDPEAAQPATNKPNPTL